MRLGVEGGRHDVDVTSHEPKDYEIAIELVRAVGANPAVQRLFCATTVSAMPTELTRCTALHRFDCGVRVTTTCRSVDWPRARRTRFLCLRADPNATSEKDELFSASVCRDDERVKGVLGVQISVTRMCQEWLDACPAIRRGGCSGGRTLQKTHYGRVKATESDQGTIDLPMRVVETDGNSRPLFTGRLSRDPCLVG